MRYVSLVQYRREGERVIPIHREWRSLVDGTPSLTCVRIRVLRWIEITRPEVQARGQPIRRETLIRLGLLKPQDPSLSPQRAPVCQDNHCDAVCQEEQS